ncbi:AIPR family protein [Plantactinospora sp. ZYX-F-223]|uniref:AIPR family protein n=1 Tax=Plantactinospora sp. ZYX-F-223 TaxID=3144103 RepID=UPI0031FCA522
MIDISDLATKPETDKESGFLSRALAALAVQIETGCSEQQAAQTIIDGYDDQGIDAVAVSGPGKAPRIWLVQSKWSHKGTAGFKQDEALKFLRGLDKILNAEYHLFNSKFQAAADKVDTALGNSKVQVTLVHALLGDTTLNPQVQMVIDEECAKLNFARPFVDVRVLGLKHFHRAILGDVAEPKINLDARIEGWSFQREPYEAYYGTISVVDVATWYEEHGRALFSKNIRDSLDLTEVNTGITETLLSAPENFWYFNNGITILCDSVGKTPRFLSAPGGVGEFQLVGASVVNGAQTVAAVHRALKQRPDSVNPGKVLVRFISLENCPEEFGTEVTKKTNTQNQVETRDFAALDQDQIRLREDFAVALQKTYAIKRGEREPEADTGCSIVEAAIALACAHRSAEHAARAKRDEDLLWERKTYSAVFGRHPNAYRVWRSVLVLRKVRESLGRLDEDFLGRGSAVAAYGDLLVTHLVFQGLNTSGIDDRETDWDSRMQEIPGLAKSALEWLIDSIDVEFGSSSHVIATCRSAERSQAVAERAQAGMATGKVPTLPSSYRSSNVEGTARRATAVSVLIDTGFIPEGTVLEFRPAHKLERKALATWLAEDPHRGQAVWTNSRTAPLLWAVDGQGYSPSGLVTDMIEEATGKRPRAIQGTSRWFWPGKGSLVELADVARSEDEV